jgi:hypothetical protein
VRAGRHGSLQALSLSRCPPPALCVFALDGLSCSHARTLAFSLALALCLSRPPALRVVQSQGGRSPGRCCVAVLPDVLARRHALARSEVCPGSTYDVQSFRSLHQLLTLSLWRCRSRRTCVRAYVHPHARVWTCMHKYAQTCICACTCIYACARARVRAHAYACACMCTRMRGWRYIKKKSRSIFLCDAVDARVSDSGPWRRVM